MVAIWPVFFFHWHFLFWTLMACILKVRKSLKKVVLFLLFPKIIVGRAELGKYFVRFLEDVGTEYFAFDIFWPFRKESNGVILQNLCSLKTPEKKLSNHNYVHFMTICYLDEIFTFSCHERPLLKPLIINFPSLVWINILSCSYQAQDTKSFQSCFSWSKFRNILHT